MYCLICVVGYERYTNIYVCEKCNIDRDKWMEDNWKSWKEEYKKFEWHGAGLLDNQDLILGIELTPGFHQNEGIIK